MSTPRLFDRRWRIEVGHVSPSGATRTTLDVSELDIEFDIAKDLSRQPNKGVVRVYNLSPEHRASLAEALSAGRGRGAGAFVRVHAGYLDAGTSLIFAGDVTRLETRTEGQVNVVTELEAKESVGLTRSARLARSFAPGTTVEAVVRAAAAELGVGEGNLSSYATGLTLDGDRVFRAGFAASGLASDTLTSLLRPAGLRWSIQDGALQVRPAGSGLPEQAIVLSESSGLVGSPSPEDKGQVSVQALIQPGLRPGARIVIRSRDYNGGYVIREARYRGATRGNDWHATLRVRPI